MVPTMAVDDAANAPPSSMVSRRLRRIARTVAASPTNATINSAKPPSASHGLARGPAGPYQLQAAIAAVHDEAKTMARARITDLQRRIENLAGMCDALARLVDTCDQPRAQRDCPILHDIQTAATTTASAAQE